MTGLIYGLECLLSGECGDFEHLIGLWVKFTHKKVQIYPLNDYI